MKQIIEKVVDWIEEDLNVSLQSMVRKGEGSKQTDWRSLKVRAEMTNA